VKPSDTPTVKAKRSQVILVVGFSAAFVRRCNEAALAAHATVVGVEAGAESAFAMQTLPLAVIMEAKAVASSPLGTIARDLGIEMIPLADETVTDTRLELLITGAMLASQGRARGGSR
jgi:hypothetical protein